MGGHKGYSFIDASYKNKTIQEISLKALDGIRIAIDFTGMLHRFARENTSNENHYILELINIIEKFQKYNIIPLFVIDGRPISEKNNKSHKIKQKAQNNLNKLLDTEKSTEDETSTEEKIIKLKKKCFSIKKEHIDKCKHIFDKLNCLYIHINESEADPILALLVKLNIVNYVYSEDFDMCLYSDIKYILRGLDYFNNTIKLYNKKDILENLNITSSQLIDIAFLTGTDYNYGLYKSTMDSNLELIKKYETIEKLILNINTINEDRPENCKILIPTYNFNYELVRQMFNLQNIDDIVSSNILKYINDYNSSIKISKNTINNLVNVKSILEYIKNITKDKLIIDKYSKKIRNYCNLHFGINIE